MSKSLWTVVTCLASERKMNKICFWAKCVGQQTNPTRRNVLVLGKTFLFDANVEFSQCWTFIRRRDAKVLQALKKMDLFNATSESDNSRMYTYLLTIQTEYTLLSSYVCPNFIQSVCKMAYLLIFSLAFRSTSSASHTIHYPVLRPVSPDSHSNWYMSTAARLALNIRSTPWLAWLVFCTSPPGP